MSKFTEFDARKLHKLYKMAHKKRSQEEEVRCEVPFLWVLSLPLVALAHTWAQLLHKEVGGPQNGGISSPGPDKLSRRSRNLSCGRRAAEL